jgi:hypothetical protein
VCGVAGTSSAAGAEPMAGPCWLLRSRGRPMLVRLLIMLSSPVERSTASDDGARLWRCCGSVSSGYSSRSPAAAGGGGDTGRLGYEGNCWTARVRGDEFTGFQSLEAGGRGGPW